MLTELTELIRANDEAPTVEEAAVSAMWFSRPSHQGREAWEMRLLAESSYALFEIFEADEVEDDREELRREMEARMRDHVLGRAE